MGYWEYLICDTIAIPKASTVCQQGVCQSTISPHDNDSWHGNASTDTAHAQMSGKDASWILTTAVIIFTMQTGFGVLESGCVTHKNEVNIMVKNALDVAFGGISYWAFGFGFSFGNSRGTNPFIGVGCFFVDAEGETMGQIFSIFLFQLSFSTTATTIVSGAMAERTKLHAYLLFSMLNTCTFSIVAHWVWAQSGFLYTLGAVDIAGCGPVHLVGGVSGLVATLLLKPRMGAFGHHRDKQALPSPLKAILGMFMLWWGWIRFCSGSVFIVSSNEEWKLAVRAAVNTIVSSIGGGITSVIFSLINSRLSPKRSRYDIGTMINGVLGSLVSITAICTLCRPYEALIIGCVGAILASVADHLLWKLRVDDPVGVIPVHAVCSIWGLLSVGLFLEPHQSAGLGRGGLLKTGSFSLLGVQCVAIGCIIAWSVLMALCLLKSIDLIVGLRLPKEAEIQGCDTHEHGMKPGINHSMLAQYTAAGEYKSLLTRESNGGSQGVRLTRMNSDARNSAMNVFNDMLLSCERNNMQLTLSSKSDTELTLTLQVQSDKPSDMTDGAINGMAV